MTIRSTAPQAPSLKWHSLEWHSNAWEALECHSSVPLDLHIQCVVDPPLDYRQSGLPSCPLSWLQHAVSV